MAETPRALFVGNRDDDDPGYNWNMAICIGLTPDQAGTVIMLDQLAAPARANIEIDPPHGDG